MKKEFIIDENTRIIAKNMYNSLLIATNDFNATINNVHCMGVIISTSGRILSPVLPIGILTKDGEWVSVNEYYVENSRRNNTL